MRERVRERKREGEAIRVDRRSARPQDASSRVTSSLTGSWRESASGDRLI